MKLTPKSKNIAVIRVIASFGAKKAKGIVAEYTTADGATNSSHLLMSGWWGVSRHFHYLPEWMAAFAWTAPTLAVGGNLAGFTYFIFLVVLLVDRSGRDDLRCRSKYTTYWDKYCKQVPYKIMPYIY
mmetsp:Transcript_3612/g.3133  ORF Transcript_3612/g.3133 Transcript_3612/m.3133 type:complete len:127 (-) Transcript_3612:410-790(-)